MTNWWAAALVAVAALAANLPLGFWRAGVRKFSAAWFVAVHLSVPFIIALRLLLGVSAWFIPLTLGMAVVGQIMGGRWRTGWKTGPAGH